MSSQVQPDAAPNTITAAPGSEANPASNPVPPATTATPAAQAPVTPDAAKPGDPAKPQDGSTPAPEIKYDLKAPEGSTIEASVIQAIEAFAKSKNLSNEQAQALLERENSITKEYQTAIQAQHKQKIEQWGNDTRIDKEIGGDKFNENVALSHGIIEKFATPQLKEELNNTGFGNHPEVVRLFSKVAKELNMMNDKLIQAGSPAAPTKQSKDVLYDKK